jgi:hypothetical protein
VASKKKMKKNRSAEVDREDAKELNEWSDKPKEGFNTPFESLKVLFQGSTPSK